MRQELGADAVVILNLEAGKYGESSFRLGQEAEPEEESEGEPEGEPEEAPEEGSLY